MITHQRWSRWLIEGHWASYWFPTSNRSCRRQSGSQSFRQLLTPGRNAAEFSLQNPARRNIIICDFVYLNIKQTYLKIHFASVLDQQQGALFKALDYSQMESRSPGMILGVQLGSSLHQDLHNFSITSE